MHFPRDIQIFVKCQNAVVLGSVKADINFKKWKNGYF